jgi:hypothetical protein
MSRVEFKHRGFRHQSTETLVTWWHELNQWRWPKGVHEPVESVREPNFPRRSAFMEAILRELGYRTLIEQTADRVEKGGGK